MTELDATVLAEEDAARVHQQISVGAMPEQVGRVVIKLLVARIDGFEVDEASDAARKAAKAGLTAPTFEDHLMHRCGAVVHASIRSLVPEDSRALIIWLVGRGEGDHGLLHPVIKMLGGSSGPAAVQKLSHHLWGVITKMNEADRVLFQERIKELNRTRCDVIRGFRMDAHWSLSEGDGMAARDLLVQSRELALRWLKQKQRVEEAGFEPWPQPYW